MNNFKAFAHNTKRYSNSQPLSNNPAGNWLLYAATPVYIETTQGGTSPFRGFGVPVYVLGTIACLLGGGWGFSQEIEDWQRGHGSAINFILATVVMILSIFPLIHLYMSFFLPTDIVTRFDHKRQRVYMWTHRGPIEIPWANLTPVIQGMATSPVLPSRNYRGMYIEYGTDGEPRITDGVPHIIQVGQAMGTEEGALFFLEYIRRYMSEGIEAVPQPQNWLHHRPRWRAMFNFANCMDEWKMEFRQPSQAPPWGTTLLLGIGFPIVFPMQFSHWLALKFAPQPRWPKELDDQHAADLAEIGLRLQDGWQQAPHRQPVVRINGELQPPASQVDALPSTTDTGRRDRLAAWVAVPMAIGSPLLFWGGLAVLLPFEMTLTEIFLWPVLMGCAATAIALLSLPRPGMRRH